jgi:hypothetical protein
MPSLNNSISYVSIKDSVVDKTTLAYTTNGNVNGGNNNANWVFAPVVTGKRMSFNEFGQEVGQMSFNR